MNTLPTWTLVVDGQTYTLDHAYGIHVREALSIGIGKVSFGIPGTNHETWVDIDRPDTWSLSLND